MFSITSPPAKYKCTLYVELMLDCFGKTSDNKRRNFTEYLLQ